MKLSIGAATKIQWLKLELNHRERIAKLLINPGDQISVLLKNSLKGKSKKIA